MSLKSFVAGAIAGPLALLAAALLMTLGGYVPVAATHEDSALTQWWLHSTYEQRIARLARDVSVAHDLSDEVLIEQGARNFTGMCRGCHTPPGEGDTATRQGLNPPPPALAELLAERSPAEAFVVLRDGVRMSGMPAFGPSHEDEELWALVAFLDVMKQADANAYQQWIARSRRSAPASDGHDHVHMDDDHSDAQVPAGHEGHDHAH